MSETSKVAAARIEVERTKGALLDTASKLLERFQPHNLVEDIWEQAKNKGADLAEGAVDAVKKRPVATGGVLAALTMFIARDPIKDAVGNLYNAMTSKKEPKAKPAALKPKEPAAKPGKPPARRAARAKHRSAPRKSEKA